MDARSSLLRLIQTQPELRYFINGHTDTVWSVAISPDGKMIASASEDNTIGLWDMATGAPSRPALTGHSLGARTVAFSPDGGYLASGGDDGKVILWDVNQGFSSKIIYSSAGAWVYRLAFSPDGKYIGASFTDKSVVVWSMAEGKITCPSINGLSEYQDFSVLAFSPDGKSLAIGNSMSDNGKLTIWDPATCQTKGESIDTAKLANIDGVGAIAEVTSLAYSPDGRQLAIGASDHLLVLDSTTMQPIREATVIHVNYRIQSVIFSPDSGIMALGMDDKTIVLLDAVTGQSIGKPLIGQRGAIRSVDFSADGHSLVSGGMDASVLVWDLQNQPLSQTLAGQATVVAFSPNGQLLASAAGSDGQIHLWDTNTWQRTGLPLVENIGVVEALAFSPDGLLLAASGQDQRIHLWDAASQQPITNHSPVWRNKLPAWLSVQMGNGWLQEVATIG